MSQQAEIRTLFSRIATHYDRLNRLLSLGQDQRWRKQALDLAKLAPGQRLLDVATGTGDVALLAAQREPDLRVAALDLTPAMLRAARGKPGASAIRWTQGDGLALPFAADTFAAVISAFMLRNVPNVENALREQARVTAPGGRVICLEFTWPRRFPMSWLFTLYFFTLPPLLGRFIAGEREAYRYLPRSVKAFLAPEAMAEQFRAVGLREVTWRLKMGGTVALYVGVK